MTTADGGPGGGAPGRGEAPHVTADGGPGGGAPGRGEAPHVTVGDELPALEVRITREQLVRYAGAALDFNPIHWNETFAKDVGLPDVIAHGMLTMAVAGRVVTDWLGDPARLVDFSARFTRPVVVPNTPEGALVEITGKVADVKDDGIARIDLVVKFDGKTVLGKPQALVRR